MFSVHVLSHIPFTSTYNVTLVKGISQTPDAYLELITHFQSSCSDLQLMTTKTLKTGFGSSHKLNHLGRQIPEVWFGSWVHNLVS